MVVESARKRLAPYVSAKVLSEFFDHIRYVREPEVIDSGLLQDYGISEANSFALLSTLKFLGVTDDSGNPTPVFRDLQSGGDDFRDAIRRVIERAYADLFSRLDVSRDSKDKIVNFFARNYSPATAERAARLFLDLCGEAGIETAAKARQASSLSTQPKARAKSSKLTERRQVPGKVQEKEPERGDRGPHNNILQNIPGARSIQLPLSPTSWATLTAPFPMTDEAWNQMITVLNVMKPALVSNKLELGQSSEQPK